MIILILLLFRSSLNYKNCYSDLDQNYYTHATRLAIDKKELCRICECLDGKWDCLIRECTNLNCHKPQDAELQCCSKLNCESKIKYL